MNRTSHQPDGKVIPAANLTKIKARTGFLPVLQPWQQLLSLLLIGGVLAALGLWLWLSRGSWVYPVQPTSDRVLDVDLATGRWGQSFIAGQSGLQGLSVQLQTSTDLSIEGSLRLNLYPHGNPAAPLRAATVTLNESPTAGFIDFAFEPLPDSAGRAYYFTIEPEGDAETALAGVAPLAAPLDAYINGSAHLNDQPVDVQLSFLAAYDRWLLARGLFLRVLNLLPSLVLSLAFLWLPGGTILLWLKPPLRVDSVSWLALAAGVSLSLYAVGLVLLSLTPITLSSITIRLLFGGWLLLLGGGLWRWFQAWRQAQPDSAGAMLLRPVLTRWVDPAGWSIVLILLIAAAVRGLMIQQVAVPLWADSYHHTLISQLIVDHGRIPSNWEPYVPLQSMNYHIGLHSMIAVFHWLAGLDITLAVLWVGQLLSWLAVPMAYLLGRYVGGGAWVGIAAAAVIAFFSQYPIYYLNWGRYTQLAGQVLLPVLMILTWVWLSQRERSRALFGLGMLLAAGLFISHYRVTVFYVSFVLALLMVRWATNRQWRPALEDGLRLALVALGALALALPRLLNLIGSQLVEINVGLAALPDDSYFKTTHNALSNPFEFVSLPMLALAGLGWALASWQRKSEVVVLGLWGWLLLLMANPHVLSLPGSGFITNFAVYIAAYIFLSVLVGYGITQLLMPLLRWQLPGWIIVLALLTIGISTGYTQSQLLVRGNQLVTQPDLAAMTWIRQHTPADAAFLTNSRLSYGGYTVAGTDAGWWLPLLAERDGLAPPLIYGMETPAEASYPWDVYYRWRALREIPPPPDELARLMQEYNLTHVYIGQRRGLVWQGTETPLDPAELVAAPQFSLLYAVDGVRIFALNPGEATR